MSQENVNVVLAQHDAIERQDFGAAEALHTNDVTLVVDPGVAPDSGVFVGVEAAKWYGRWFHTFADDYRFEIIEVVDAGGSVVVVARHRGTGRTSGAAVEMVSASAFWIRGGLIWRVELYRDKAQALEAAGLSE